MLIDPATGMLYVVKRPSPERRNYSLDFVNLLNSISTVVSVTNSQLAGLTNTLVLGTTSGSSTVVTIPISGGADGDIYQVTVVVSDTSGDIVEESIMVKIKLTGNS